jgi:hypothetical protein
MSLAVLFIASIDSVNAAGIVGSAHDLSAAPTIGVDLGICGYCHGGAHAPEGATFGLWDRNLPTAEFTLYSSPTMNSPITQPSVESLLCLSCHDGITAFDAVAGLPGTPDNNMVSIFPGSLANIGYDLRGDHPVGVEVTQDSAIRDESFIIEAGLPLYNGKVECPTCHEVHGDLGFKPFLRLDPDNSALCSTCHIK